MSDSDHINRKFAALLSSLSTAESGVLAYSGGVDSSFLLTAMKRSGMRLLAVTAFSETMPQRDFDRAVSCAQEAGVEHVVIRSTELFNDAFTRNAPDRCFFCKEGLFKKIAEVATERGYAYLFDGTNADDLSDYRPGRKAAALYRVKSPLAEHGFSKEDIRTISRELGLSTWNQPSSPCLSSRFPYGSRITREGLRQVEQAEEVLREAGLEEFRVRHHGDIARIEVTEKDMKFFQNTENRRTITEALRALGFTFISLDLEGYRSGSMNRSLKEDPFCNSRFCP